VKARERNSNYLFAFFSIIFLVFAIQATLTQQLWLLIIPFVMVFLYAAWQMFSYFFMLLLFLIPFSMEYQITDTLGTDFPDEPLMILFTVLGGYYWVYHPAAISRRTIVHPLLIIVVISLAWTIISSLFSTLPLLSFKFLLAKAWYFGAFIIAPLVLFQGMRYIKLGITVLVTAMVATTLIILVRHATEGFTFVSINEAVKPFFRNHVNYSALLVCIIPVVFVYWQTKKAGMLKSLAAITLIILLLALFLSYARGAWLALFTGIGAAWLIRRKAIVMAYAVAFALLLVALFWLKNDDKYLEYAHDYRTTIWHENFQEHLSATYELKDASTAERFYRWIAGVRMVKDNWLTGYGPNSFYYNYKPYTVPAFRTWVSNNPEHSTVHNYFLLVTIEQGIPGLLFFLLLTAAMLYYAQHLYHRVNDIFYRWVAMLSGVIIIMILTVNCLSDLIETDKVGSLFFLCLSLLVITDRNAKNRNSYPGA
jgi:O-antigen ligase